MGKRTGVEVSIALADAVKLADADVIAAYPITPQTHIVEHLAELVAEGCRVVPGVENTPLFQPAWARRRPAPAPSRRPRARDWS